jgi:hypothetical protein
MDELLTTRNDMEELHAAIDQSGEWLFRAQDKASGGWAEQQGKPVNSLNTAEAMIALLDANLAPAGDHRIKKAVQFLFAHQCVEETDPDQGSWPREATAEGGHSCRIPDIVRTSFIVEALIKAGKSADEPQVKTALAWISALQNSDYGWGYRRHTSSALMPTCFALATLITAHKADPESQKPDQILSGLRYLVKKHQTPRGSFGEQHPLEAVHTIYATIVLQSARVANIGANPGAEEKALQWLLDNPDAASQLREEKMAIDPEQGRFDYSFLFMTDSLLLKVLTGSLNSAHRESQLALDALMRLRDKRDSGGGFYGYRVFSWSTAKAISALAAAKTHYPRFPTREPETAVTAAPAIRAWMPLIFLLVFLIALIWLTQIGGFNTAQFIILILLLLAALLAYGFLSEGSFTELFRSALDLFKGGKPANAKPKSKPKRE